MHAWVVQHSIGTRTGSVHMGTGGVELIGVMGAVVGEQVRAGSFGRKSLPSKPGLASVGHVAVPGCAGGLQCAGGCRGERSKCKSGGHEGVRALPNRGRCAEARGGGTSMAAGIAFEAASLRATRGGVVNMRRGQHIVNIRRSP